MTTRRVKVSHWLRVRCQRHTISETDDIQCGRISARPHTKSAFDSSVIGPAVFVSGVVDDDNEGSPVVGQRFPLTPSSMSASRCFSYDVVDELFKATVGPNSDVLALMTETQLGTAGHVDVMPTDCRDTTGLLSASGVQQTAGRLKPNHYSSLW